MKKLNWNGEDNVSLESDEIGQTDWSPFAVIYKLLIKNIVKSTYKIKSLAWNKGSNHCEKSTL